MWYPFFFFEGLILFRVAPVCRCSPRADYWKLSTTDRNEHRFKGSVTYGSIFSIRLDVVIFFLVYGIVVIYVTWVQSKNTVLRPVPLSLYSRTGANKGQLGRRKRWTTEKKVVHTNRRLIGRHHGRVISQINCSSFPTKRLAVSRARDE